MIEVVLFHEEADSPRECSGGETSTAEPPASADDPMPAFTSVGQAYWGYDITEEPVGIFVDVEDGDPLTPAEEVVLDVAVF